jgi:hypothetical protein
MQPCLSLHRHKQENYEPDSRLTQTTEQDWPNTIIVNSEQNLVNKRGVQYSTRCGPRTKNQLFCALLCL